MVRSKSGGNEPVEVGSVSYYLQLGDGFKHFLFSPLPGEMIQFN